ncbi:MAG: hypothetical protein LAO03_19675 [Acidobacteriia bacterium]|nr:hypothetical protein [Terriglobia bacterium]
MTNDRMAGLALIAGSAGVIVTLSLHPSGRELFEPGKFESAARTLIAVHSLALCSLPVWFLGACGLSRRVGHPENPDDQLGFAGLVLYGFAMAAMMVAVVMDGLVTPGLARHIVETTGTVDQATLGQSWRIALRYNGILDEAFVRVFITASSAAIGLWSVAIVRSRVLARGLGVYGCVLGAVTVIALISGQMDRYPHIFGMVVVGQAIWFVAAGGLLCRERKA